MSKRILILTPEPTESGGGVEHFVREISKGLRARGYEVAVLHRENSEPEWLKSWNDWLGHKVAGTLGGYWIGKNAQRQMNNDVVAVISNSDVGYYGLRGQRSLRKIHFYHGTYRGQAEAIRRSIHYAGYLYLKWWHSMVLERLSGRDQIILCNSEKTCAEVRDFFGYDPVAMWLPIDTVQFSPGDISAARSALGVPKEKPVGLFVGSSHPMKGFPVVQALVEKMPDIHWILAFRGDMPETRGQSITVLQNVAHDEIPTLYRASDFSLCPSLYEPFGYVVAESLACGTPVIASLGGASRLLLSEAPLNPLLISRADSADAFCDAIRDVLRQPEFYRRAVEEHAQPKIKELMSPENWWRRFAEAAGL